MGPGSSERVVVFIDWQNLYKGARDAFHRGQGSGRLGNVDPLRLAQRLLQVTPRTRELAGVRVYRGRPDPSRDPYGCTANQRQQIAWERAGITVVQRPLRYPKAWPAERPQEKGVDVALAVDFVMLAVSGADDVGILMSTTPTRGRRWKRSSRSEAEADPTVRWPRGPPRGRRRGCASPGRTSGAII
jgi:hypothetical protein